MFDPVKHKPGWHTLPDGARAYVSKNTRPDGSWHFTLFAPGQVVLPSDEAKFAARIEKQVMEAEG